MLVQCVCVFRAVAHMAPVFSKHAVLGSWQSRQSGTGLTCSSFAALLIERQVCQYCCKYDPNTFWMVCELCVAAKQRRYYCSRECQKADWPLHRLFCWGNMDRRKRRRAPHYRMTRILSLIAADDTSTLTFKIPDELKYEIAGGHPYIVDT